MLKKTFAVGVFALLFVLNSSFSVASEINLPQTGQTRSYRYSDDSDILAGQPFPSPRFTTNGNGTVTDNLTGLVWLQNANCSATLGGVAKTTTLTWANALIWSNNLASGACGLTDGSTAGQWRLPTILEMESLVDISQYYPALSTGHPFSGVQNNYYWSSTRVERALPWTSAWYINMGHGELYTADAVNPFYVWPVRGGL